MLFVRSSVLFFLIVSVAIVTAQQPVPLPLPVPGTPLPPAFPIPSITSVTFPPFPMPMPMPAPIPLPQRKSFRDCMDSGMMMLCFHRLLATPDFFHCPLVFNASEHVDVNTCCPRCKPRKLPSLLELIKMPPCTNPLLPPTFAVPATMWAAAGSSSAVAPPLPDFTADNFTQTFFDEQLRPKCNFGQVVQPPNHEKPEDYCDVLHLPACPLPLVPSPVAAAGAPAGAASDFMLDPEVLLAAQGVNLSAPANPDARPACPKCRLNVIELCPPEALLRCALDKLPECADGVFPMLAGTCCPTCRPPLPRAQPPAHCDARERMMCLARALPPCAAGVAPVFDNSTCCFDCVRADLFNAAGAASQPRAPGGVVLCTPEQTRACVAAQPVCADDQFPFYNRSMCCMSCKRPEERCSPKEVITCRSMTRTCPQNVTSFHAGDMCCPVCRPAPKVCLTPRMCHGHEICAFKNGAPTCRNVSHVHLHLHNMTAAMHHFVHNVTLAELRDYFVELLERFCRVVENVDRCRGMLEALRNMQLDMGDDFSGGVHVNVSAVPPDADEVQASTLLPLRHHAPHVMQMASPADVMASLLGDALMSVAVDGDPDLQFAASATAVDSAAAAPAPADSTPSPASSDSNVRLYAAVGGGVAALLLVIVAVVLITRANKRRHAEHVMANMPAATATTTTNNNVAPGV